MILSPAYVIAIIVGALCYFGALYLVDRSLDDASRTNFRYAAIILSVALFFYGLQRVGLPYDRRIDITKAMLAITAACCVFYEQHRIGMRRPIAERWKRFAGITLGLASIIAYFNGLDPGYPKWYHRHDQYHYYMGAKYFPEMGYDGLYRCAVIAEDELGVVKNTDPLLGTVGVYDMKKEVRAADMKIRNLGGDNLLVPVTEFLDHPEICKATFSPERWNQYKQDVRFFRIASDKGYWDNIHHDHGFNPPPAWIILGRFFAELAPAGSVHLKWISEGVLYVQMIAALDIIYMLGMFAGLYWAFGWRIFAVSAIFFGCQSSAPYFWTGGAFLRQDWLFYMVMAACLARKKYYKLAGACMVYTGLLRIFPGLTVIGWLAVVFWELVRRRRLTRPQGQMLIGGVAAAAVLIPLSMIVCGASTLGQATAQPKAALIAGKDAYQQFKTHTLEIHDRTPLTNHMGLRVLVSHSLAGRMKYTEDHKLRDPFEVWMRLRNERYDKYKGIAYAVIALSLAAFVYVMRRVKSMWVAQCLAQVFIILLSQLTSYYYAFMILAGPLTRVKRGLEAPLFGFAALSQFVFMTFGYNDDKYTALTLISLLLCYGILCWFSGKRWPGHDGAASAPDGAA
jgi:hypothetical protein